MPDVRRTKPGYPEEYYALFDGLADSLPRALAAAGLIADEASVYAGETGAVVTVRAGGDRHIVRLAAYDGELYTSAYFYSRLAGLGVPAPVVRYLDHSHAVIPHDYQVLSYLPGVSADALPTHLRRRAGELCGAALRRVHALPVDGFGSPLPDGGWSADSWLGAVRDTYLHDGSMAHKNALFTPDEQRRIEALTHYNPRLEVAEPRLIHSDVGEGNALYTLDGGHLTLSGLIDPGPLAGGDPLFDLPADPTDPASFAAGLWAGYTRESPLTPTSTTA